MKSFVCKNGCCRMHTTDTIVKPDISRKRYNKKAGVFITCKDKTSKPYQYSDDDYVLLVQSYHNLWGIPKGTFEKSDENDPIRCALREVLEETGLSLRKENLGREYIVKDDNYFYYTTLDSVVDVPIRNELPKFDVTSIGWFKVSCLKDFIKYKIIKLNYYTKMCFSRYFHLAL